MRNKYLSGIIVVLLLLSTFSNAWAEAQTAPPGVESITMERDGNRLSYPQLTGWQDEAVQQRINDDIVLSAGITSHMITFATLTPDSLWGLQVTYEAYVTEWVASFIISAEGKMPNGRQGQTNTALSYDLATGERIQPGQLFADAAKAQAWLEEETLRTLGEEISDYEDSSALLPLPMTDFSLDAYGITFWYAPEQFRTVSGRAGACRFDYAEIQHLLATQEDSLPVLSGMVKPALTPEEKTEVIRTAMESGKLEQLPVTLGDSMKDLVDTYGLTRTPDEFPGGRYFVMEHPLFRSVLLISDAMEAGYDDSILQGIQLRRGGFCGLLVGQACQQDIQSLLGDAHETIQITDNMAYDYGLPSGECYLYHHNGRTLRFYVDENSVLTAVQFELYGKDSASW
ncbi:MAG: hypothetical protein E7323_04285 [Clostridiales bacterium]|nr:hypothetical protein [Clostridiales bacterium]